MMTVKIISVKTDGREYVDLFPTSRVSYHTFPLNDGKHPNETVDDFLSRNKPQHVVSGLSNPATNQNMEIGWVMLYDEDGSISPLLITAPATCYVMSEGKTIDRFTLNYLD